MAEKQKVVKKVSSKTSKEMQELKDSVSYLLSELDSVKNKLDKISGRMGL